MKAVPAGCNDKLVMLSQNYGNPTTPSLPLSFLLCPFWTGCMTTSRANCKKFSDASTLQPNNHPIISNSETPSPRHPPHIFSPPGPCQCPQLNTQKTQI